MSNSSKSVATKAIEMYNQATLINRCLTAVRTELAKETETEGIKAFLQMIDVYSSIIESAETLATDPAVIGGVIAVVTEVASLDKKIKVILDE